MLAVRMLSVMSGQCHGNGYLVRARLASPVPKSGHHSPVTSQSACMDLKAAKSMAMEGTVIDARVAAFSGSLELRQSWMGNRGHRGPLPVWASGSSDAVLCFLYVPYFSKDVENILAVLFMELVTQVYRLCIEFERFCQCR